MKNIAETQNEKNWQKWGSELKWRKHWKLKRRKHSKIENGEDRTSEENTGKWKKKNVAEEEEEYWKRKNGWKIVNNKNSK